ncbi:unnamed protein product [Cuscuta epithymum]|uniref:Uncharacterized protein n=1 Tax=Cuscuta epithymum TaxID=186058 RepID=A0AAV0G6Y2_9ASTE|nr:unnamed protein product [Cuscuta epithymum]
METEGVRLQMKMTRVGKQGIEGQFHADKESRTAQDTYKLVIVDADDGAVELEVNRF